MARVLPMDEKLIRVPTIFQGPASEQEFREELGAAIQQDCLVVLDFQSHPAVSSSVLGQILFHVKDIAGRVAFVNVSNYMYGTLHTIMGPLTDELVRGPIQDLDDTDVLDGL